MTGSPAAQACLLYFDDERPAAERLAAASGLALRPVQRHRFPDGELKLTLPVDGAGQLPARAVLLRSLYQPNDKLVELLLAARAARALGVRHLTLVAPYLAYMRQDIAFHPGEAVSQRIVGPFLASLFDAVVTVDPHLHRVATLPEAVPAAQAVVVSGAPLLADWIECLPNASSENPRAIKAKNVTRHAEMSAIPEHGIASRIKPFDAEAALEAF